MKLPILLRFHWSRWGLLFVLLIAGAAGWRLAYQVPLYSKPNEIYHAEMIDAIKLEGRLPRIKPNAVLQEYHQPPLYYLIVTLLSASDPAIPNRLDHIPANPHFLSTVLGNRNAYSPTTVGASTVYIGRLVGLVLLLITVLCTYWQARFVLGRGLSLLAALLVATHLQGLYIATQLSNDGAVLCAATVALGWLTYLLVTGLTARRAFILGVLLGVAVLCKVSALLIFGALPFLFWQYRSRSIKQWFGYGTAIAAGTLLISGWWLLRNLLMYGDMLSLEPTVSGTIRNSVWGFILKPIPHIFQSFWLDFSAGLAGYGSPLYYHLVGVVLILAAGGLVVVLIRMDNQRRYLLMHSWLIALVFAASAWQKARIFATGDETLAAEGRHVLIILPSIAILVAAAFQAIPFRRVQIVAACGLTITVLGALLWAIGPHLNALYALPSMIDTLPMTVLERPVHYDNGMRLLAIRAQLGTIDNTSGQWIDLEWTTDKPLTQNLSVSVQLFDQENGGLIRHGQQDSYPGGGLSPTLGWYPGLRVIDRYFVPGTGTQIGVFVYNLKTGQSIPAVDGTSPFMPLPSPG